MKLFDENGMIIHEFDLLKVFHFTGSRRKKHYMYKWVRMKDGALWAHHLEDADTGFWLRAIADKKGVCDGVEIVQGKALK